MNDPLLISFNTAISLAYVISAPALFVWMALSFHVWTLSGRIFRRTDYRLAVSYFLFSLTLLILDIIRLRLHVALRSFHSDDTVTWMVFVIRWNFAAAVWWATLVLYGHYARAWGADVRLGFRRRRDAKDVLPDPYLEPLTPRERNSE